MASCAGEGPENRPGRERPTLSGPGSTVMETLEEAVFEHPDPRCAECEHMLANSCEPAAEALRRLGYPAAEVRPAQGARALLCPDFRPRPEAVEECAEEAGFSRLRLAAARARGLLPR